MSSLRSALRRIARVPGVRQTRAITERAVTPHVRVDVHELQVQVADLRAQLEAVAAGMKALETYQPAVFNAISSTNGITRTLMRETAAFRRQLAELDEHGGNIIDESVDRALRPHIDTIAWLLTRVETVRAEMMHELRYGSGGSGVPGGEAAPVEPRVITAGCLDGDEVRLNLGAGHIALPGFVNVDLRELPGIDVVAPIDRLPVAPASVAEIFSSHTLEHFPELQLSRTLLPYWHSLLKPGGTFRAVVPDLEAMSKAYVGGAMPFEQLRAVAYGGQEYEGDFHFTGFTPESLAALLRGAGFDDPAIIARGRPNGDCLEFEIAATRPAG
jgi:hypothetical protein